MSDRYGRFSQKARVKEKEAADSKSVVTRPKGIESYKPKEGIVELDVIPFILKKYYNPLDKKKKGGPGTAEYMWPIRVHWGIGPDKQPVACAAYLFGEDCAVCDHMRKMAQEPDFEYDQVKGIKGKDRELYLVREVGSSKVQLLEQSYFGFGEVIKEATEDDDDLNRWMHPKEGCTLKCKFKKVPTGEGGGTFIKLVNVKFKERTKAIKDELIESMPALDTCIKKPDYDEIKSLLGRESSEDDEDDDDASEEFSVGDKVSFTRKGVKVMAVVLEINEDDKTLVAKVDGKKGPVIMGFDEVKLVKGKAKKGKAKDEDDEDDEDDEEEEKPKKGKAKDEDDDDEDDEEESEDEDDEDDDDSEDEDDDEEEDSEDDGDDDDDDEDEKPKKKAKAKPKAKPKKKK